MLEIDQNAGAFMQTSVPVLAYGVGRWAYGSASVPSIIQTRRFRRTRDDRCIRVPAIENRFVTEAFKRGRSMCVNRGCAYGTSAQVAQGLDPQARRPQKVPWTPRVGLSFGGRVSVECAPSVAGGSCSGFEANMQPVRTPAANMIWAGHPLEADLAGWCSQGRRERG